MAKVSFRDKVLQAREDAIIAAVHRLLAEKGFDAMTVDEVAAEVGIAKASLYKHFSSKEDLGAAAMIRLLEETLRQIQALRVNDGAAPIDQLKDVVRWAMRTQLAGAMPLLPAQNSALRAALMANDEYLARLMDVSEHLGAWIGAAQAAGDVNQALPPDVVLYTLFARACDPVLGLLKAGGNYDDERIVELLLSTCFDGLGARGT